MERVTIHEFSTGIVPETFADRTWQSRGFIAQFMNATLDPIPYGVKRAIANKLFAVVEGTETTTPAIIGREVYDQNTEKWWSVVALVNQGRDEKGRPISVTRYFLTEEKGNLWKILAWIYQYQKAEGRFPVFNPLEVKTIDNPTIVKVEYPSDIKDMPSNLGNQIVVKVDDKYNLQDINKAAENRMAGNKPVSWAFNVEALEAAGNFTLIKAANLNALESIKAALTSIRPITENELRLAIKSLMYNDMKSTAVEIFAKAVTQSEITKSIWHKHFDGEGADKGLSLPVFSGQIAKLLTLRSLVIPQALSELLAWLKQDKTQRYKEVVIKFSNQFIKELPEDKLNILEERLISGIKTLLFDFPQYKLTPEEVSQFLNEKDSIWTHYFKIKVLSNMKEYELKLIAYLYQERKQPAHEKAAIAIFGGLTITTKWTSIVIWNILKAGELIIFGVPILLYRVVTKNRPNTGISKNSQQPERKQKERRDAIKIAILITVVGGAILYVCLPEKMRNKINQRVAHSVPSIPTIPLLNSNQNISQSQLNKSTPKFSTTILNLQISKNNINNEITVPPEKIKSARQEFVKIKTGIDQVVKTVYDDLTKDPNLKNILEKIYPGSSQNIQQGTEIYYLKIAIEDKIKKSWELHQI